MFRCVRCGAWVGDDGVVNEDQGYAYCGPCEDSYQAALRAEYPFGQCQECGARYQQATCELGKVHTYAMHAEGACSQWGDVPDWPPEMFGPATGYCAYGCKPAPRPRGRVLTHAELEDMPF